MTPSGAGRGGAVDQEFPPLLFSPLPDTAPETSGHFRTPYSRTAATPMRGGAADSAQRSLSTRRSATPGSAMSAEAAPTPPPLNRLGMMPTAGAAGSRPRRHCRIRRRRGVGAAIGADRWRRRQLRAPCA